MKVGSGLPKELEGGFLAPAKPLVDTTAAAVWERFKQVVPVKTAQAKNKGEDGKEVPATGFDAICEYPVCSGLLMTCILVSQSRCRMTDPTIYGPYK